MIERQSVVAAVRASAFGDLAAEAGPSAIRVAVGAEPFGAHGAAGAHTADILFAADDSGDRRGGICDAEILLAGGPVVGTGRSTRCRRRCTVDNASEALGSSAADSRIHRFADADNGRLASSCEIRCEDGAVAGGGGADVAAADGGIANHPYFSSGERSVLLLEILCDSLGFLLMKILPNASVHADAASYACGEP